jgi:hypothetical protein
MHRRPFFVLSRMVLALFSACPLARAAILDLDISSYGFVERQGAAAPQATWGVTIPSDTEYKLDRSTEGLGCEALPERASIEAWVLTEPRALGAYGQPWEECSVTVEIYKGASANRPFFGKVFVRHGPDKRHWTSWQPLRMQTEHERAALYDQAQKVDESRNPFSRRPPWRSHSHAARYSWEQTMHRKENLWREWFGSPPALDADRESYIKQIEFVGELGVPRATRARYERHLEAFAVTQPARPHFQADAVRWLLEREPDYFAREVPFIGYLQVLVEDSLGSEAPQ